MAAPTVAVPAPVPPVPAPAPARRPRRLRPYLALARTALRAVLAHRLNFVLGLFAVLFQLVAMLSVWSVLLRSGADIGGFTWPQMKAYLLVAYGTGALMSFGDFRLAARIRDGMVAVDLTKPVDFQRARFAEALGVAVVETAFTAVVCAVVVALTGAVTTPPGPAHLALFALSALLVLPLKFCIVYGSALVCFWTQNFFGVSLARVAVTNLFSGALIPLTMLPGWLYAVAMVLPFASMTFTPALIWLGHVSVGEAVRLVAIQAAWVVALWWGARLMFRRAVRQLTVHGG